jgi:hypothetical protein
MRNAVPALVIAAIAVGCGTGSAPTFTNRPESVTPCERAYAAAAYAWEDQVVDPTPRPGGAANPDIPVAARLAILGACSIAELTAASGKFVVHENRRPEGRLVPYWSPSRTELEQGSCSYEGIAETRLCRELLGP